MPGPNVTVTPTTPLIITPQSGLSYNTVTVQGGTITINVPPTAVVTIDVLTKQS